MKIRVLPRAFFERLRGTLTEELLLKQNRIISIEGTSGSDSIPPFSERFWEHPHLLILHFDDVLFDVFPGCAAFSTEQAEKIFRFADDGTLPLLVHCTAGISRSGAVGEILDWYFNRYLVQNDADHEDFLQNNRQILPNPIVRRRMLEYLRSN